MLTPGFSKTQIPAQVRLFVAVAVTLSLTRPDFYQRPAEALSDDPIPASA